MLQEVEQRAENWTKSPSNDGSKFPVHIRRVVIDDPKAPTELTFAEFYWADLTRIKQGRLNTLLALFRVIFESHHFVDALLDRKAGIATATLRRLLLFASWIMRGPIAGLSVATAISCWAVLYVRPNWQPLGFHVSEDVIFRGVLSIALLGASAGSLILLRWTFTRRDTTWTETLTWIFLLSTALAGLVLTNPVIGLFPTKGIRQAFVETPYTALISLWFLWGVVMVGSLVTSVYLWRASQNRINVQRPASIFAALGIICLQFLLWTAVVGTAIMPLLYRSDEVIGITEIKNRYLPQRCDTKSDTSSERKTEVDRKIDEVLNASCWYFTYPASTTSSMEGFVVGIRKIMGRPDAAWIDRFIFAYGYNGFILITLLLIGVIIWSQRKRCAARVGTDKILIASNMPRFLVGKGLLTVLITLTFIQILVHIVFGRTLHDVLTGERFSIPLKAYLGTLEGYRFFITSVGFAAFFILPILMGSMLSNGVHIARDLIDHQLRATQMWLIPWRLKSDYVDYPRRRRTMRRFETVVCELLKGRLNSGTSLPFDHLVFVAHSQGSIIAFDYFNDASHKVLGGLRPDLITVGSPLDHLYKYYFHEYADLDQRLGSLRERIGSWINLYRNDDYIGVHIGPLDGSAVINEPLPPGGHTDYWGVARLVEVLQERVKGARHSAAASD
jgi:hypothetical protein